jgi:cytochrome P450
VSSNAANENAAEEPRAGDVRLPWNEVGLGALARVAIDYQRDPIRCFARVRERFGPTAAFARRSHGVSVARPLVVTTDPRLLRRILTDPRFRNSSLTVSGPRGSAHRRLRHSIFRMHGEEHRRNRRLITPAMQKKSVERLFDPMVAIVDGVLGRYSVGETRDVAKDMKEIARQIAAASLFGLASLEESEEMGRRVEDWLSDSFKLMPRVFGYDLPGTAFRKMLRKADHLERVALELVERKRKENYAGDDLLTHLVRVRDEGGPISEGELLGHIHILFLAAHETTSHSLSWTLMLLAQHPDIFERLCAEIRNELPAGPNQLPTPEALGRLDLLDRVIDESLRLFPIVPFGARIASEDLEIEGQRIVRKTRLMIPFSVLHHDAKVFPEPERFDPDRWLGAEPPPYSYLPFSAGLHMCIGVPFAKQSMQITLAMMLARHSFQMTQDAHIDRHTTITMSPKQGVPLEVLPRDTMPRRARMTGNALDLVTL